MSLHEASTDLGLQAGRFVPGPTAVRRCVLPQPMFGEMRRMSLTGQTLFITAALPNHY